MLIEAEITKLFLQRISNRLSSRDDCRGIEYKVRIHDNFVEMDPRIEIFPTRYRRKPEDRVTIVEFVTVSLKNEGYNLDYLVKGEYIYQNSVTNKSRRWVKLV